MSIPTPSSLLPLRIYIHIYIFIWHHGSPAKPQALGRLGAQMIQGTAISLGRAELGVFPKEGPLFYK